MDAGWTEVFIGLGSNLDDPEQQLLEAAESLATDSRFRQLEASPVYLSEPLTVSGSSDEQPRYLNAVLCAYTVLTAPKLLKRLQEQENLQGRKRFERWGARTLDLDILLYGDDEIDQRGLQVPHYALTKRLFVVQPLADLRPKLTIPGHGKITQLLAQLNTEPALGKTDIKLLAQ